MKVVQILLQQHADVSICGEVCALMYRYMHE